MLSDFVQANKIYKKKIINNNPIWHIAKESAYIYQEIYSNKRQAIVINIDFPPEFSLGLDPSYIFKGRHLTIDKKYKTAKQQHGLYLAHYTEEYSNKVDGSSIKIHVYLDKNAQCIYVQAKQYNSYGESTIVVLPSEISAINNSNSATKILNDLLTTRRNKYLEAIQNADQLEEELCNTINLCLNNSINFEMYSKKAYQFIKVIEEINSYVDDYIDMRGKIVETILGQLNKKISSTTVKVKAYFSTDNHKEETYEEDDIKVVFICSQTQSSDDLEKEKNKLLEQLNNQLRRLNKVEDLLEKQNILQNIKTNLLILTFNETLVQLLSPRDKLFIANLEKQVYTSKSLNDQLFILFIEKCFLGDLDTVKKLFVYVHGKIDSTFIYNILKMALAIEPNTETSLNIIKIMDFLYEQSPVYRMFFPVLTDVFYNNVAIKADNQPYQISKYKIEQLNNKLSTKDFLKIVTFEKICLSNNTYKVVFFPLFKAIYTKNMPLVNMLLKHGILANSLGAIIITDNENDEHTLTTIKASFFFKCNIEYIALLYKYEAFTFRNIQHMLIFESNILLPCINFNLTESDIIVEEYSYKCPLILFLDNNEDLNKKQIDFFKHNFMNYSNLRDLTFTLAYLARKGYLVSIISFRSSFNNEPNKDKILFFQSEQECKDLIYDQKNDFKNIRLAYHSPYLYGICNMINILYQYIMGIIKEQSIDENINIMLYLESRLETSHEALINLKMAHLNAALLLLSFKDQLTEHDLRSLVKILISISKLLKDRDPKESAYTKKAAEFILKNFQIENYANKVTNENNFNLALSFSKPSSEPKLLYTCEPPPGSKVINGKTKVSY